MPDLQNKQDFEGDLMARYRYWRHLGKELNDAVVKSFGPGVIKDGARQLAMLEGDAVIFKTEDQVGVLMDYCMHHVDRDGRNSLELYLANVGGNPDHRRWLEARIGCRYSLFQVEKTRPGEGLEVLDAFRGDRMFVADVNFSRTAVPGVLLATHLIEMDDFWMTGGAALPVSGNAGPKLAEQLEIWRDAHDSIWGNWTREEEADFVAIVMRTCLHENQSTKIRYEDANYVSQRVPELRGMPLTRKDGVGRNDPCPCGSGKKYKKCCAP
jgi:hypothetical protein